MIVRALLILALVVLAPGAAWADAIDGAWCHAEQGRMTIHGPRIETVTGRRTEGDYTRHSFRYVAPGGDPGAGGTIAMILMGENMMRVRAGDREETWRRCGPPTS